MEKLLLRLARQLDSLDEASLMSLWSKYATMTSRFEPTKRWEDACLIFSLIQAKHWKNQLFNCCWSQQRMPPLKNLALNPEDQLAAEFDIENTSVPEDNLEKKTPCRVLPFKLPQAEDCSPKEE